METAARCGRGEARMQNPWLVLTAGAALLGAASLAYSVVHTLALLRQSLVARLPLRAEQEVDFAAPGDYVLHVEQPRFALTLAHAGFVLRSADDGREVRSAPILFRTLQSGVSAVRLSVRRFAVVHAGRYELTVSGLPVGADPSRCALIFTRPYGAALFLSILGIVAGGCGLIAGSVLSVLAFAGKL